MDQDEPLDYQINEGPVVDRQERVLQHARELGLDADQPDQFTGHQSFVHRFLADEGQFLVWLREKLALITGALVVFDESDGYETEENDGHVQMLKGGFENEFSLILILSRFLVPVGYNKRIQQ